MSVFRVEGCEVALLSGDITRQPMDAIVNAANAWLAPGGGVCGAIHSAAGPALAAACEEARKKLPGGKLATGEAALTPGFNLKARFVIHAVGPVYGDDRAAAPRLLASAYTSSLKLCREHGLTSVAFPAISTGIFGYPLDEAAHVALTAIRDDLEANGAPRVVRMMLFGESAQRAFEAAAKLVFA